MNEKGFSIVALLVCGALILGGVLLGASFWGDKVPTGANAGPNVTVPMTFHDTVDLRGRTTLTGEVVFGANNCASASWNPGAVVSSTVATTSLALDSTYSVDDLLFATIGTSTAGVADAAGMILDVTPTKVASGTEVLAVLSALNGNVVSINLTTTTLRVCYVDVTP